MKPEIFLTLKNRCLVCGEQSNEIRIHSFRGGVFGEGIRIALVCCDKCWSNKMSVEEAVIQNELHKQALPGGLERRHIELVG